MTKIAHYFGWLQYWFRMGASGWDYEQVKASRLFAAEQMKLQTMAEAQNRAASQSIGTKGMVS